MIRVKKLSKLNSLLVALLIIGSSPALANETTFAQFVKQAGIEKLDVKVQGGIDLLSVKDDKEKQKSGLEKLIGLADGGNVQAQLVLGRIYKKGDFGQEQDLKQAVHWMIKSAEGGNSFAQALLAGYYWNNKAAKDPHLAMKWANKSAEQNDPTGYLALGLIYTTGSPEDEKGKAIAADGEKALQYFQKASDGGEGLADYMVTIIYANGLGTVEKSPEAAFKSATKGATRDNTDCMVSLGKMYYTGTGVEPDIAKGLDWLEKAVEKPDCDKGVAPMLGVVYLTGEKVPPDFKKAREYLALGSANGSISATANLASVYYRGLGVEKDVKKAVELWQKAVAAGDQSAMIDLGILYIEGQGVEKDAPKGIELLKKVATAEKSQGVLKPIAGKSADGETGKAIPFSAKACVNLGLVYRDGEGVEKDYKEALKWFKLGSDKGSMLATSNIGSFYMNGYGVDKDPAKGLEYVRKAADGGEAVACYNLAKFYAVGLDDVVKKDDKKALEWLEKSAEAGYSKAAHQLAEEYVVGKNLPKNMDKAFKFYTLSAKSGNQFAKTQLGVFYIKGWGTEKDVAKGKALLEEVADMPFKESEEPNKRTITHYDGDSQMAIIVDDYQPDAVAACALGLAYRDGDIIEKDEKKAFKYLLRSSKRGHSIAMAALADFYLKGIGTAKDVNKAFEYTKRAAEGGVVFAQYNLGCYYETGEGVEKDLGSAKTWYKKALDNGFKDASAALDRLDKDKEG